MSVFLPSLKKSGLLDQIQITVCVVGSRKIESQDDYGSQGWSIFAPNLTIYGFDADPEACEQANADLEARQVNWTEKHIPVALGNIEGYLPLYITNFTGSSSLYPPNEAFLKRFDGYFEWHQVIATVEIETTTLDKFCHSQGIKEIDFLQVDVQGADLQVLQGGLEILSNSILAVKTEVGFNQSYINQPLFSDVDVYLRNKDFTLLDLVISTGRGVRTESPIVSQNHAGTLIWGDAFYFRDLIAENSSVNFSTPERILKLACIADVLEFPDYALELLAYLTRHHGEDSRYNFAHNIIESLDQYPDLVEHDLDSMPIITEMRKYLS